MSAAPSRRSKVRVLVPSAWASISPTWARSSYESASKSAEDCCNGVAPALPEAAFLVLPLLTLTGLFAELALVLPLPPAALRAGVLVFLFNLFSTLAVGTAASAASTVSPMERLSLPSTVIVTQPHPTPPGSLGRRTRARSARFSSMQMVSPACSSPILAESRAHSACTSNCLRTVAKTCSAFGCLT